MDHDDKPAGTILSRRDALKALGVGSAALLAVYSRPGNILPDAPGRAATFSPSDCVIYPELPTGPYFVDGQLNRSDIRFDPKEGNLSPGVPLYLGIAVYEVSGNSCKPLEGARVDLWHCDFMGIYSGVEQRGFNTTGQQFLRGYQLTDKNGVVQFRSVFPGWYSGRTVHIHFKIRTKTANGQPYEFTSQFFFEDALTDHVHDQKPYKNKGQRDTRNAKDPFFKESRGQVLLKAPGNMESGLRAFTSIGLDLTDHEMGAPDPV